MAKAELSVNLIIVAAIAILVLVIIVFLLGKQFGWFNQNVECTNVGGRCEVGTACTDGSTPLGVGCGNTNTMVCCRVIPG